MTTWINHVYFGCLNNATNQEQMRRLGVALYSPGYTNQQRRQIIQGTLAYDANDPEALNFGSVFLDDQDREILIGKIPLKTGHWNQLSDAIVNLGQHIGGATKKYARLVTLDGISFLITSDNNVAKLNDYIGMTLTEEEVYEVVGLRKPPPSGPGS